MEGGLLYHNKKSKSPKTWVHFVTKERNEERISLIKYERWGRIGRTQHNSTNKDLIDNWCLLFVAHYQRYIQMRGSF